MTAPALTEQEVNRQSDDDTGFSDPDGELKPFDIPLQADPNDPDEVEAFAEIEKEEKAAKLAEWEEKEWKFPNDGLNHPRKYASGYIKPRAVNPR
eukprot:TRINITY_DN57724_c0_g1_i1.p1 TRINITY_DN57724_c0_g1~~TRINITY_DN57724_c0_g1_i1.p1  ORF type:complete len:110 (+),score=31.81 TRINITY_DN57724_c0_g1_i1:48-332(+)